MRISPLLLGLALLALGCGNREPGSARPGGGAPHAQVHDALELLEKGEVDAALARLRALTPEGGIRPDALPDWHARAVAGLIEHERFDTADSLLQLAGPLSRRPPEQRYLTAQLAMLRGDPDQALRIYDTVTGEPALMAKVYFERAMIHSMRGDHERAARESRAVLDLHAHDRVARALLISSLIALDRPMVALSEAAALPHDRSRWTLEAHAWLALGDADSASVRLDQALEESNDATLQYLKGWALVEQGEPAQALAWLADLAEIGYKDAELHAARAMEQLGRTAEAALVRDRYAERQRQSQVDQLWSHGLAAVEAAGPEAALPYLEEAVALDPTNAALLNDTGAVLTMLERYDAAETRFREALALRPEDPSTYGNLVQLYELTGDQQKREDALRRMADAMANQ